jgi:hypothetical protein
MEIMAPIKKGGDLHKKRRQNRAQGESMTGGHKKDFCPFCCDRPRSHWEIFFGFLIFWCWSGNFQTGGQGGGGIIAQQKSQGQ